MQVAFRLPASHVTVGIYICHKINNIADYQWRQVLCQVTSVGNTVTLNHFMEIWRTES